VTSVIGMGNYLFFPMRGCSTGGECCYILRSIVAQIIDPAGGVY
jgi:hypothetical protein